MWGTWTEILSLLFSLPVVSPGISPGCVFWGWLQLHSWVQAGGWCLQSPSLYFPLVVTCVWEYEHAEVRRLNKIIVWTADCWYHPSNCEGFYSDTPRTAAFYHEAPKVKLVCSSACRPLVISLYPCPLWTVWNSRFKALLKPGLYHPVVVFKGNPQQSWQW